VHGGNGAQVTRLNEIRNTPEIRRVHRRGSREYSFYAKVMKVMMRCLNAKTNQASSIAGHKVDG
jgi:hypothetical protein